MALTIKEIPESRQYIGNSCILVSYTLAPGTSDYVNPGGYVIQAASLGLGHIWGADIEGVNQTVLTNSHEYFMVLAQTSPASPGLTSVAVQVFVLTTGAQAANGANLTGEIVVGQFYGY